MDNSTERKEQISEVEINSCISVLEHLLQNGDQLIHLLSEGQYLQLMKAAGQITRPGGMNRRGRSNRPPACRGGAADAWRSRARGAGRP